MKRSISPAETALPQKKLKSAVASSTKLLHNLGYPSIGSATRIAPVPLQQPSPLLTFSYTPEHVLEFNNAALRYYVDPPPRANLQYGYDRWIRRPEERGRIDSLLQAVSRIKEKMDSRGIDGNAWLRDIGVVSWRGVMTKILTAPYEERDEWELNIMVHGSTLYLEEHLSSDRIKEKNEISPHHRKQMYYGYAFESYCTSPHPQPVRAQDVQEHPRGWGGDVDTNVQWCSVVKTKLDNIRIVIGGEVDCVRGEFTGKTDTYVELKTSMTIRNAQDEARFEKKLLKFYFQSFLLGVPEIVVGFRTPSGQLSTVQKFKTMEIPRLVRDKPGAWDPLICLDWGKRFFNFLQSTVTSDTEKGSINVWRAKFTPREGVTLSLLGDAEVAEVVNGEERIGFLPKWYVDSLKSKAPIHPPSEDPAFDEMKRAGAGVSDEACSRGGGPSGWRI